jgi:hypothetical protein
VDRTALMPIAPGCPLTYTWGCIAQRIEEIDM